MIRLTVTRPNTIGETYAAEFDSYADAEETIERRCERLADRGWELSELSGSTTRKGTIECTHDGEADVMLIRWETPEGECRECGTTFDLGGHKAQFCSPCCYHAHSGTSCGCEDCEVAS